MGASTAILNIGYRQDPASTVPRLPNGPDRAVPNRRAGYMIACLRRAGSGRAMEPIDYAGALRRSWRLLVVIGLGREPSSPCWSRSGTKKVKSAFPYEASVMVGSPPAGTAKPLRAGVTSRQILFFANSTSLDRRCRAAVGLKFPPPPFPVP